MLASCWWDAELLKILSAQPGTVAGFSPLKVKFKTNNAAITLLLTRNFIKSTCKKFGETGHLPSYRQPNKTTVSQEWKWQDSTRTLGSLVDCNKFLSALIWTFAIDGRSQLFHLEEKSSSSPFSRPASAGTQILEGLPHSCHRVRQVETLDIAEAHWGTLYTNPVIHSNYIFESQKEHWLCVKARRNCKNNSAVSVNPVFDGPRDTPQVTNTNATRQFRVSHMHVLGLWEEPSESPRRHGRIMQTPHNKAFVQWGDGSSFLLSSTRNVISIEVISDGAELGLLSAPKPKKGSGGPAASYHWPPTQLCNGQHRGGLLPKRDLLPNHFWVTSELVATTNESP